MGFWGNRHEDEPIQANDNRTNHPGDGDYRRHHHRPGLHLGRVQLAGHMGDHLFRRDNGGIP